MKLLLEKNALQKQTLETTDQGFIIRTDWNEKPFLERCAELRGMEQKSDGFRHVGSIPAPLLQQWMKEDPEILEKPNALLKKLMDPDYALLRTVDRGKL